MVCEKKPRSGYVLVCFMFENKIVEVSFLFAVGFLRVLVSFMFGIEIVEVSFMFKNEIVEVSFLFAARFLRFSVRFMFGIEIVVVSFMFATDVHDLVSALCATCVFLVLFLFEIAGVDTPGT